MMSLQESRQMDLYRHTLATRHIDAGPGDNVQGCEGNGHKKKRIRRARALENDDAFSFSLIDAEGEGHEDKSENEEMEWLPAYNHPLRACELRKHVATEDMGNEEVQAERMRRLEDWLNH